MKLDHYLSVKKPAYDVLRVLNRKLVSLSRELDQKVLLVETAAWYNGRERGISIVIQPRGSDTRNNLVLVVSEARGSDNIVVWHWVTHTIYLNPPTSDDFTDEVYHHGTHFMPGGAMSAAKFMYDVIVNHLKKLPTEKTK